MEFSKGVEQYLDEFDKDGRLRRQLESQTEGMRSEIQQAIMGDAASRGIELHDEDFEELAPERLVEAAAAEDHFREVED